MCIRDSIEIIGTEHPLVADLQSQSGLLLSFYHRYALLDGNSHCFFAEHMLTCLQSIDGHFCIDVYKRQTNKYPLIKTGKWNEFSSSGIKQAESEFENNECKKTFVDVYKRQIIIRQCETVEIHTDEKLVMETDGETIIGDGPYRFSILAKALYMVVA